MYREAVLRASEADVYRASTRARALTLLRAGSGSCGGFLAAVVLDSEVARVDCLDGGCTRLTAVFSVGIADCVDAHADSDSNKHTRPHARNFDNAISSPDGGISLHAIGNPPEQVSSSFPQC